MSYLDHVAYALSNAFYSESTNYRALLQSGREVLGHSPLWLMELCECLVAQKTLFQNPQKLQYYIRHFPAMEQARVHSPLRKYFLPTARMHNRPGFIFNTISHLNNQAELLKFLQLSPQQLHTLSKPWLTSYSNESFSLSNYRYRWQTKSNPATYRLIEIPKPKLKRVQQKIASGILDKVPLHANAHGFRKGYSTQSCAAIHQNKRWLLKMDLKNFFLSISYARVYGIFRLLGYPANITRSLSLLTTHNSSDKELKRQIPCWQERQIYHIPHLPQGAPSSPVLSNIVAYKLDCRLTGLSQKLNADYSRYADDLFFSANNSQDFSQLVPLIAHICQTEGFQINFRKTRILGAEQQQKMLGMVVNQGTNPSRKDYNQLKAILFNCVKQGVTSQQYSHPGEKKDFYAWLLGKIAYIKMLNPHKAEKLEVLFKQINWQID